MPPVIQDYEDKTRERSHSFSPSTYYDAVSIVSLKQLNRSEVADPEDESEDELANDLHLQRPVWSKRQKRKSEGDHYTVGSRYHSGSVSKRDVGAWNSRDVSRRNSRSSSRLHSTLLSFALDAAADDLDIDGPMPRRRSGTKSKRQSFLISSADSSSSSRAHVQQLPSRREQPGEMRYPKSHSPNFVAPFPVCSEKIAVKDLLKEVERLVPSSSRSDFGDQPEFIEFELSHFSIYLPENRYHPFELRGLQHLATRSGHSSFLLDGVLTVGKMRRYVEAVPIKVCSIGNYDPEFDEVGTNVWIQSDHNSKSDVYYRLNDPAPEYERYHVGFTWLANFAKHFVDYCMACDSPISVHNFRSDFFKWVSKTHEGSKAFHRWHHRYGKTDYRRAVCANIHFLFKESIGVSETLRPLLIWHELLERDSVPAQPIVEDQTIVTPYVYECFKDTPFGHCLKVIEPSGVSDTRQSLQEMSLDLTSHAKLNDARMDKIPSQPSLESADLRTSKRFMAVEIDLRLNDVVEQERRAALRARMEVIKVGDVLSVTKDGDDSVWKDEVSRWKEADECWYVYVQAIHISKAGRYSFDAIWLYKPSDTCCAKMKYPFPSELFMSDNCTCTSSHIMEDDVLSVVPVSWNGSPSQSNKQIFIRQTYMENEQFVTLKESHKHCKHMKTKGGPQRTFNPLPVGTTVLVEPSIKSNHTLEPYEIAGYVKESDKNFAVCRRLLRRNEIDGQGRPNELVYSGLMEKHLASKVTKCCRVRFYPEIDAQTGSIPAPYSRDGCGNSFYITSRLLRYGHSNRLAPIGNNVPMSLIQGFDPLALPCKPRLRGMDLYCGGGNFGRGLEEGGAIKNEWAVDINRNAIHAYAANLDGPNDQTKLFYGSVNDLLSQAMRGNPKKSDLIPLPGDVDFISAGSPCQGFSILNPGRNNEKGLRNQSLVASVAAYVDLYRPKYGLLENVMTMAQKGKGRDNDSLSQLICCIVGMGYQVQLFVVDAWSCGSPQSRSRLFVSFAAPGLVPLEHPELSHSHPKHYGARGLGKLANGQSFGQRQHIKTPFEYVTAREATKHLPKIDDGFTYQCIEEPDHVLGRNCSAEMRAQIEVIPRKPRGMCFAKAWDNGNGVLTPEQRALFYSQTKEGNLSENNTSVSSAWGRVNPHGLFPTITGALTATDSRTGYALHWDEHRYLTTMEARIAQGFPDDEVLPGNSVEGWKIMGNSVARPVAISLGLAVRNAWEANKSEDGASSALMHGMTIEDSRLPHEEAVITSSNRDVKPTTKALQNMFDNVLIKAPVAQQHSISVPKFIMHDNCEIRIPTRRTSSTQFPRDYEVPDSEEGSDEELELDKPVLNSSQLQILAPAIKQTLYSSGSDSTSSNSLKRRYIETRILPPVNSYKATKVAYHTSPSSAPPHSSLNRPALKPSDSKMQAINPAALTSKLNGINLTASEPNHGASSSDNAVTEVVDDAAIAGSIKPSPLDSRALASRFDSRSAVTPRRGADKASSGAHPVKPTVKTFINLISDDEDELVPSKVRPILPPSQPINSGTFESYKLLKARQSPSLSSHAPILPSLSAGATVRRNDGAILPPVCTAVANNKHMTEAKLPTISPRFSTLAEIPAYAPIRPPVKKYIPVDNTAMNAYAKTNGYLGLGGARHDRR